MQLLSFRDPFSLFFVTVTNVSTLTGSSNATLTRRGVIGLSRRRTPFKQIYILNTTSPEVFYTGNKEAKLARLSLCSRLSWWQMFSW